MSTDSRFKSLESSGLIVNRWFGIQVVWDSSKWLEIHVMWDSDDVKLKWFQVQMLRDSIGLRVIRFEIQLIGKSLNLRFNWCEVQLIWDSSSSRIEIWKLKNEAFQRDFLQNWSFPAQKRNFWAKLPSKLSFDAQKKNLSARLPSKMKLWSSKTRLFGETSFKDEASNFNSDAVLRDILQEWHVDQTLDFKIPIRFRDFQADASKVLHLPWKSRLRHTNSSNCHAKWPLQSNVSVPWNLQPSRDSASEAWKSWNINLRKHCACHAKSTFQTLFKPTTPANALATRANSCACRICCNVSTSLRLPREKHFEPPKVVRDPGVLTVLPSKSLSRHSVVQILRSSASKNAPKPASFNDFDFQIALAPQRGANFGDLNFQKCPDAVSF